MSRRLKIATLVFMAGDRLGVHIQPAHYYSPVASRRELRRTEQYWRRPLQPIPFEWDLDVQASWLLRQVGEHAAELPLRELRRDSELVGGLRYGQIEAQLLYSFIRSNQPGRIVEIGSGSSTLVMSRAVERNVQDGLPPTAITACDPHTASKVDGLPHVEAKQIGGLQVDDEVLALAASGDLLFIDSTHSLRTGSELPHLYLELLPQLPPGVVVHIHDIYLPYLFAPAVYQSMFDWQETTLVAALLAGNDHFQVLTCTSALHHERQDVLRKAFPDYRPQAISEGINAEPPSLDVHFPSSLWLGVC